MAPKKEKDLSERLHDEGEPPPGMLEDGKLNVVNGDEEDETDLDFDLEGEE